MLDSLYTEALRKKGSIATDIEEMMDDKIDLDKNWTQIKVQQAPNDFILAAGDGSFNQKKYLSFNLYAVAAESIIYNPNDDLKTVESVELDVIQHQSFVRERLRNMMSIFEIKTALKTINNFNPDYYMDDGSILGDLIRPIPTESTITPENKKQIANKIFTQIKTEDEISSFKFKEEFKELFEEIKDEDSLITYLETLEHLIALKNLLNHRDKIIAVSKTSTSNDLFHSNVPDMAILDKLTRAEGYSRPIYKKVNSEVKRDFPVFNEFFRDMWFTVFFTRLEDNKNIVKIELPYYANEEKIKEIIGILKSNATDGYPFLLKKAHHDVVIKHKDMENLSNILEIIDKSGREML